MDPLAYMIEDCWNHLFQFLSAMDKQALCDTCKTFQAMLQPQKTSWGLELILPFILKELYGEYSYRENDLRKKALKSVLELRQVCKSWRAGFDKYYGALDFQLYSFSPTIVGTIQRKYDFYGGSWEKFLTFFKGHQGNPFIGRRVSINATSIGADEQGNEQENSENEEAEVNNEEYNEDDDFDEDGDRRAQERERRESILKNRELVMEALSTFGKEIDYLRFARSDYCSLLDAYEFLQIVLCNCSNLQSLEICMHEYTARRIGKNGCQEELLKPFAEYFVMNQLPKMDRLRDLNLSPMDARLEKLMLEGYGPTLQSLKRSTPSEIPMAIWGSMKFLQTLSLYNSNFEQARTLLQAIKSPLETLSLQTGTDDDDDSENVFKIDKFLLTVQHLPLKEVSVCPGSRILKESAPFPDEFPKHETILKFTIVCCQVYSRNFFQFLPNLQRFEVNRAECEMKLGSYILLPVCCLQSDAIAVQNSQNMDPLDYMVEDCWLHLFQFLSARDKQALCQTCLTFQAMLQPQKTCWGLELILPLILKEFSCYKFKKGMKAILKLRQVCKSWREGFDNYCGTLEYKRGIFYPRQVHTIRRKYDFRLGNNSPLEQFLTFFKDHQGNPLIGGNVLIYAVSSGAYESEKHGENSDIEEVKDEGNNEASKKIGVEEAENEEDEEFDENDEAYHWRSEEEVNREMNSKNRRLTLELLTKFGKHIRTLNLYRGGNCSMLDACIFLRTVLSYCQNLQSLEVNFYLNWDGASIQFQKRLAEYFKINQLPKESRLRELKLCTMNALAENLILEGLGPNLQSLERNNTLEIPVAIWSNMQCLQNLSVQVASFDQIETLLLAINSPLETLTMGTDRDEYPYSVKVFKIDKFLRSVQHLPLKEVTICSKFGILKEEDGFPADFPKHQHVLKFSVENCSVFSSNFLQFLPSLQSFVINGARCPMKLYK